MLEPIIQSKARLWLSSEDCSIKHLIAYMKQRGKLRQPQIEAIEIYLLLKIKGENKPLWQLFAEGFFSEGLELATLNINEASRNFLAANTAARALYEFAQQQGLYELEKLIISEPENLPYTEIIQAIFYHKNYPDYLMSLPMGAGKTYLMAAFIYLDLYFASSEPDNKAFAHNFLVLIPSGLKSSIVPSLKTIEHFEPNWVIAEPAASNLKKQLEFLLLDKTKAAPKSNKARNPNAQKVSQCLPHPFAKVFVVNAEKVILDRLELSSEQRIIESDDEEKDRYANELRTLIGKIPNLTLMIDEVHHAAKDDIKLRQVVNRWHAKGNITTVLGFSGTPYLTKPDKISLSEAVTLKFSQITNTVYYYPLTTAIRYFLKKPKVKIAGNLQRSEIIRRGIEDFQKHYHDTIYDDGTIAKLAIYCSNIAVLEEVVYPLLLEDLAINPAEILKYHRGNKLYPIASENEREFRTLDTPLSHKRYILLVQIGKEGWDCRSLTGVILSQKGDCPQNMVLQTSCRCLRQVSAHGKTETALIWLNEDNAKILNKQLEKEQKTNIDELNNLKEVSPDNMITRHARVDYLELPKLEFYQLQVNYQTISTVQTPQTAQKLAAIVPENYKAAALVQSSNLDNLSQGAIDIIQETGQQTISFGQWLFTLSKESLGTLTLQALSQHKTELRRIFQALSYEKAGQHYLNDLYDHYSIQRDIRLAFCIKRQLKTSTEVLPQSASLLIVDKLAAISPHDKLYPNAEDSQKILELDNSQPRQNTLQIPSDDDIIRAYETLRQSMSQQGLAAMIIPFEQFAKQYELSSTVKRKNHSFHYLPYDFKQSRFELNMLQHALNLKDIAEKGLEIYFNGERGLTEFVIHCVAKRGEFWHNIGKYTSDFLIIERRDQAIHRALIVETKGAGYSNDPVFLSKKRYVENEFLSQNNTKFGYARFDFLYLEDSADLPQNLSVLSEKIQAFFKD